MSLTQHLYRPGPIRAWWEAHSAGLDTLTEELIRYAYHVPRLSQPGAQHAAAVGGIVGRRVETMVELAPPYAAILAGGRCEDACYWPTHAHLAGTEAERVAVEWRPTPAGWRRLVPAVDRGAWSDDLWEVADVEINSRDEREKVDAAAVITALESAYRSGQPASEVGREAIADEAVDDAMAIVGGLSRSVDRLADLCGGQIRGHAAPVFAPHWADGDLLVGPGQTGGYGLLDVKTVGASTLARPRRTLSWLWQLLSYAVTDVAEDIWRIRAVGLLLPRQDAVVVWPLDEVWRVAGIGQVEVARLADLLQAAYDADRRAALGRGQVG
jgi:hypothetical protein